MRSAIGVIVASVLVAVSVVAVVTITRESSRRDVGPSYVEDAIPHGFVEPDLLREHHDLTYRQLAVQARISMKSEAADELIRGEATLTETAARFRDITLSDPVGEACLRASFPDATDAERHYRNVLAFVRCRLLSMPGRASGLLECLESEMRARFPVTATAVNVAGQ